MCVCVYANAFVHICKLTGLKRLHRGFLRVTSRNPIERQGPFGVPPVVAFVGFAAGAAALGVANQVGILAAVADILSKLFILSILPQYNNCSFKISHYPAL